MESEPLVRPCSRNNMNYTAEDGSSILGEGGGGDMMGRHSVGSAGAINGEKGDGNATILERFHEDALQQVGHGKMQLVIFVVCGLALAADLSELMALIMSSKSAQFEFCVDASQKSWLVGATLLGMGIGSIFWGSLGDRLGRKKTLVYCLGVGSIFSVASAIMPTEGLFITARIFSGFGLGGVMPLVITYFNEFIQEKRRRLATTVLFLWWPIGAAYVVMISWFILPSTGFHLNEELKEHFSAWRRLLLAAWAPSLLSLIAFIFMPEAPLNLLQNGRDAESLSIYKQLHKCNKGSKTTFCFSEIEIPSPMPMSTINSPRNVLGDLYRALDSFRSSILLMWTENRRRLTLSLSLIWLMAAVGQGSLSSWVISHQATLRDWTFDNDAKTFDDNLINNTSMTADLINVRYRNCVFQDVTLENMLMNHVKFENCSFHHVNFTNVKTSHVLFIHSELTDCFLVDTNLGRSDFKDCVLEDITYQGLDPECHLIPDFNMHLSNDVIDSGLPVAGIFIGSLFTIVLVILCSPPRLIVVSILLILSASISVGLTIWKYDPIWALVGHTFLNGFVAASWSLMMTMADKYPTRTRSSVLGLCLAGGRVGSFLGVGLFGTTIKGNAAPVFSSVFLLLSSCLALRGESRSSTT
ncbi:synaptic vesicle glycoprotein 2B isoform X2 [Folsomia candida]|uniref:Synaptic vesicle glycoprotein 2B n=2 Tax=Folsomia candida TaxID=158441 RepID=A0A226EGA9_FOLCA|nr:synaptic vesicle glycoprotein 2B isoform X2 [Folsomia candida]XP_035707455.1 synaptic vesicle glycoprotein 2B isoform X2 [Folsomia candida]OXA56360.1 Synaptic vesicle glycoprotein 2B [Folsomia candida]